MNFIFDSDNDGSVWDSSKTTIGIDEKIVSNKQKGFKILSFWYFRNVYLVVRYSFALWCGVREENEEGVWREIEGERIKWL